MTIVHDAPAASVNGAEELHAPPHWTEKSPGFVPPTVKVMPVTLGAVLLVRVTVSVAKPIELPVRRCGKLYEAEESECCRPGWRNLATMRCPAMSQSWPERACARGSGRSRQESFAEAVLHGDVSVGTGVNGNSVRHIGSDEPPRYVDKSAGCLRSLFPLQKHS